jgi:hypothetical protein
MLRTEVLAMTSMRHAACFSWRFCGETKTSGFVRYAASAPNAQALGPLGPALHPPVESCYYALLGWGLPPPLLVFLSCLSLSP